MNQKLTIMKLTRHEEKFDESIERALQSAWMDCPSAEDTIKRLKTLILVKGKEYRRNNDPYHNFIQGGKIARVRPMAVLNFFRLKHKISVSDLEQDFEDKKFVDLHQVNEKFNDILVYTLIELAYVESEGETSFAVYREFMSELNRKLNFTALINARD
tara:strand:+ start:280 stop:753 length:474 start_codon:yes stop_codon:yes gene_type:complete